ncbi:MAG: mechanosensitive ion channel [Myxococcales bacterium]|nr:mechanosensitive ion channel [Myxococcales bacterium]MCB9716912.1 mechanosensitive ion channel [Myxococcales bacterium]
MSAGRLERAPLHRLVDEAERLVHTEVVDRSTTETLVEAIGDLAVWVLGGLLLLWLMRLLVTLVRVSPLPASLKASALRLAPVVELVVALAYVTSALYELLTEQPEFAWTLVALIGVLAMLSWSALYDLACGVVFRVSRVCQPGDLVEVGDARGRVIEVGMRALVLQTRQGDEAVVPYGSIARRPLRRTQSVSGAYVHAFGLGAEHGDDVAAIKRRVVEAVTRCHWASVVHEPKVERRDGGTLEVSVYAHDADHAPLVEAAVRQALSAARPATRSPSTLGPSTSGERPLQKLFSSGPSLGPIAPPRSTDQS